MNVNVNCRCGGQFHIHMDIENFDNRKFVKEKYDMFMEQHNKCNERNELITKSDMEL